MFSREYTHKDYCLAHLFTDLKFEGGILGLAYVGSPRRNSVGGICTPGECHFSFVRVNRSFSLIFFQNLRGRVLGLLGPSVAPAFLIILHAVQMFKNGGPC